MDAISIPQFFQLFIIMHSFWDFVPKTIIHLWNDTDEWDLPFVCQLDGRENDFSSLWTSTMVSFLFRIKLLRTLAGIFDVSPKIIFFWRQILHWVAGALTIWRGNWQNICQSFLIWILMTYSDLFSNPISCFDICFLPSNWGLRLYSAPE